MLEKSASITMSGKSVVNLKDVFKLKERLVVNRDGLTVGDKIRCQYKGDCYEAVVTKIGYAFKGRIFYSLSDLTYTITGIKTNSLKMWHIGDLSLYDHLHQMMEYENG